MAHNPSHHPSSVLYLLPTVLVLVWPLPPLPDPNVCLRNTQMKSHAMFRFFSPGRVVECRVINPAGKDGHLHNEFHLLGTPHASGWIKERDLPSSNDDMCWIFFLVVPIKDHFLPPPSLHCSRGSRWHNRLFLRALSRGWEHSGDVTLQVSPCTW